MEGQHDPRFRSFLWSQTRKKVYAETRLSTPDAPTRQPASPASPAAAQSCPLPMAIEESAPETDSPPNAAKPPEGVPKRKLTPLEQAAMRLSEHCVAPRQPDPEADGQPQAPAQSVEAAWTLHVLRRQVEAEAPLPRLNVRTIG